MQTLLVEVKDINGLKILQDIEQAHIIKLIHTSRKTILSIVFAT